MELLVAERRQLLAWGAASLRAESQDSEQTFFGVAERRYYQTVAMPSLRDSAMFRRLDLGSPFASRTPPQANNCRRSAT